MKPGRRIGLCLSQLATLRVLATISIVTLVLLWALADGNDDGSKRQQAI